MPNTNLSSEDNNHDKSDANNLIPVSSGNDDDVNVLSGDNKIDVEIEPDVKANKVNMYVQLCSCSIIFHCFSNNNKQ
jgi:hypothetical protein